MAWCATRGQADARGLATAGPDFVVAPAVQDRASPRGGCPWLNRGCAARVAEVPPPPGASGVGGDQSAVVTARQKPALLAAPQLTTPSPSATNPRISYAGAGLHLPPPDQ